MSVYRGIALTVAGSDSGGGAGIQADLKTFAALRVFGTSVITAVTAQNSLGVQAISPISPKMIERQMRSVCDDFGVSAVKTGMLGDAEAISVVAATLRDYPVAFLVVDPVMEAKDGCSFLDAVALDLLQTELLPLATLVTPNVPEAEKLAGIRIRSFENMVRAARIIAERGVKGVLIKGGHLDSEDIVHDVLLWEDIILHFESPRIESRNGHGTGCTLSAAITAELATGCNIKIAVERARAYVFLALHSGHAWGRGFGALGHAVDMPWVKDHARFSGGARREIWDVVSGEDPAAMLAAFIGDGGGR